MKENMGTVAVVITDGPEPGRGGHADNAAISSLLYLLHALKHSGRVETIYCFTADEKMQAVAEEYGCKVVSFAQDACIAVDMDEFLSFCLKMLQAENDRLENVLLVHNGAPALSRFPLNDFLSIVDSGDYDLAFSAEKEHAALWRYPATAREGQAGVCAEPLSALHNDCIQVKETGEVYAFSATALQKKKKRVFMRAKPVFPLNDDTPLCIRGGNGQRGVASSEIREVSENLAELLRAVRHLDGIIKSFLLSQGSFRSKGGAARISTSPFPNGIQKFLIAGYAYLVWLADSKYHYNRLKKDPVDFFRVTEHPANVFFLKILGFLGPTPRS